MNVGAVNVNFAIRGHNICKIQDKIQFVILDVHMVCHQAVAKLRDIFHQHKLFK